MLNALGHTVILKYVNYRKYDVTSWHPNALTFLPDETLRLSNLVVRTARAGISTPNLNSALL